MFGDRDSLVAALSYRWTMAQQAQLDMFLTESVLEERLDDLRRRATQVYSGSSNGTTPRSRGRPSRMRREGGPAQTARSWVTWALAFGIGRTVIKGAHRSGDIVGRLELDPVLREDPFPGYEQLRGDGPISRHRIMLATVDHAACTEILRGDDFGVAGGHGELPRPLRRLLAGVRRRARRRDRPAVDARRRPARPHPLPAPGVQGVHAARDREPAPPRRRPADDLLDPLEATPSADLVSQYARLLPVTVIAEILGVPADMRPRFLAWGERAAPSLDLGLGYRAFRQAEDGIRSINGFSTGTSSGCAGTRARTSSASSSTSTWTASSSPAASWPPRRHCCWARASRRRST